MNLVFVGAVASSRVALEILLKRGVPVSLVVTLDKRFAKRHSDFEDLEPLCRQWDVPLLGVDKTNDPAVVSRIAACRPDYLFVIGWSQIVGPELLALPSRGALGYHPALLPENRGRAAIPWSILSGQDRTGSTLFFLDEGMDSGDIVYQREVPIAADETAASLIEKHLAAVEAMMHQAADTLLDGSDLPRRPQDHNRATYTARRRADDGLIDWRDDARDIATLVRAAGSPYPGAFTFEKLKKLIILEAFPLDGVPWRGLPGQVLYHDPDGVVVQCGRGHLKVVTVKPEGGEALPAVEHLSRLQPVLGVSLLDILKELKR